ncbi:TPA: hypothetical protein ACH3X1_015291 [Trebouxia sp. C0004]
MPSIADFDADFIVKVDQYLKEGLIPPMEGGFELFCSTAILDEYANAWNVTAAEVIGIIKLVLDRRVRRLARDATLGVNHTQEGLFAIVCEAVSDFAANKQEKLAAAMNPALQDEAADFMHEEEELPPANADVNNGLEYPPPSAFLKHILKGKTDPTEVMQLTSMYFREYDNQPSKYGSDYSMVSRISSKSGKSTSKSRSPECFYGRPADHGYPAKSWIFTFQLYLAAEDEHNPVAKAATYLRGDALDWWQQSGYVSMPPDADFEQFTSAFLKRFVKPADSAKARRELPLLRQEGQSVETYAAKFNNMNNRITEGTAIDSTTLAVYFQQGLARRISTALVNSQSIATMQDLALVMAAAEEIESKLDLSAKQATQAEVPATGNPNSAKRVRYGNNKGGGNANASFNNISTNNRGGGRGPFTAGRGNAARGRGTRGRGGGRGSPPGQSSQTRGRGWWQGFPPWPVISASV